MGRTDGRVKEYNYEDEGGMEGWPGVDGVK